MSNLQPWYKEWFDSPYYHTLYKDRDNNEAQRFLKRLMSHLSLDSDANILDLACGKGRHSIFLNELGYSVTGVDLSNQSIEHAKAFENDRLKFIRKDMREISFLNQFDLVLNLFTSFGYFENEEDDLKVLSLINKSLKSSGLFLIDYLNSNQIRLNSNAIEHKSISNLDFKIRKFTEGDFIVKDIALMDQERELRYQERVRLIDSNQFEKYFKITGFEILAQFGNYNLEPYNPESSPRLIYLTKNTNC